MINTSTIKSKLYDGFFHFGGGDNPTRVLILGSCRSVAYSNYLKLLVDEYGANLLVYHIDPFDYHWDVHNNLQHLMENLTLCEQNHQLLDIISKTDVFIHEFYKSFGMFNTNREYDKNIYQFGMNPDVDISIPNWHNKHILAYDIYKYFGISDKDEIRKIGMKNTNIFYQQSQSSSVPEFAEYFLDTWRKERLFWTFNHISDGFSRAIWKFINDGPWKISDDTSYWNGINAMQCYQSNGTPMTELDEEIYRLQWDETIIPFTFNLDTPKLDIQYADEL